MYPFIKTHWLGVIILSILLAVVPLAGTFAQEATIAYGQTTAGSISYQNTNDEWQFTGTAGDVISIVMHSTQGALDPYLAILDNRERIIATNDDYAGTDAAIINFTLPVSGQFTVRASGFEKTTGSYTLDIMRGTPPLSSLIPSRLRSIMNGSLSYGAYVQGVINEARPFESWQFEGRQGDTVSVSMSPLDFNNNTSTLDPYLYLYDPSGNRLQVNDDNGNSLNAKILTTLPANGTYTIIATTYKQQTIGNYWLLLNRESVSTPIGGDSRQPVITAPPTGSTRLGGLDVQDYCRDQGYAVELVNQRRNWACVESDSNVITFILGQSDFDAICQSSYGDPTAVAVLNGTTSTPAFNWNCYGFNVAQSPAPQPQPSTYIGTLTPRYAVEVNVRTGPGTSYESLGVIDWRQSFPLIRQTDEWYIIDYNGEQGYVSSRWATVSFRTNNTGG